MSLEKCAEQESKCHELLHRINALVLEDVETLSRQQLDGFSAQAEEEPSPNIGEELEYARIMLRTVLEEQSNLSDDDTESSTDDDSCCDELEFGTGQIEHYLPIEHSPGATWARQRADIVSSWNWLENAISHVSLRIKQHEEVYKHLKATKTPVTFDEHPAAPINPVVSTPSTLKDALIQIYKSGPLQPNPIMSSGMMRGSSAQKVVPVDNFLPLHYGKQRTSKLGDAPARGSEIITKPPQDDRRNNIGGGLEALQLKIAMNSDPTCISHRCMPVKKMRPRKLLDLSKIKRELLEAKPCGCRASDSCSSCLDNTEGIRLNMDSMSIRERAAILDHTYHKSLSLSDEIPVSLLLDASLKTNSWKNKSNRRNTFQRIVPRYRLGYERLIHRTAAPDSIQKKKGRGRPKLPRKLNASGQLVIDKSSHSTAVKKIRNVKTSRRVSSGDLAANKTTLKRRKYNSLSSSISKKRVESGSVDYDSEEQYDEDYLPSTSKLPGPGRPRADSSRRKTQQDYDIDNIVIPYSIASTTRVEKIEYKEIQTPSWRVISTYDEQNLESLSTNSAENLTSDINDSDVEDILDETVEARHDRCEVDEHKKFAVAISLVNKSNIRRGRRTDSKSETIDPPSAPESPKHVDSGEDAASISVLDATLAVSAVKVNSAGRRRRSSMPVKSLEEEEDDIARSNYGFELRGFPLSSAAYARMASEMPTD